MKCFGRLLGLLGCLLLMPLGHQTQTPTPITDTRSGVSYVIETYHPANFPVAMVFAPDGRLFYTEKINGRVRVIDANGEQQFRPVLQLPTSALQERGMLGIALDPAYNTNRVMYVVHTREGTSKDWPANELVRFQELDGVGLNAETLLSVPITTGELLHNGGNVHFDANGLLYLSLGDYGQAAYAQDLNTPQGAIHRFQVTADGLAVPADNPFADNSIYAYGLRNPFDFTFDPVTGNLFSVDVGPSCDDEINLILAGFNYGWRENYTCVGRGSIPEIPLYVPPLLSFTPVIAPTGITFYDGAAFPEWQGDLFFCDWVFGDLRRVILDTTRTKVEAVYPLDLGGVQCRLDLIVGPDGAFYFGTLNGANGAIMRLRPAAS